MPPSRRLHRPGIALALGLRAWADDVFILLQTAAKHGRRNAMWFCTSFPKERWDNRSRTVVHVRHVENVPPHAHPVAGVLLTLLSLLSLNTSRALPGLQAPLSFDTGSRPVSAAVGDFNQDGIPDLAVANQGSDTISILLGRGDGAFQAARSFSTGSGPRCVAVADVNGDGLADLVVANAGSHDVSVLLGNG